MRNIIASTNETVLLHTVRSSFGATLQNTAPSTIVTTITANTVYLHHRLLVSCSSLSLSLCLSVSLSLLHAPSCAQYVPAHCLLLFLCSPSYLQRQHTHSPRPLSSSTSSSPSLHRRQQGSPRGHGQRSHTESRPAGLAAGTCFETPHLQHLWQPVGVPVGPSRASHCSHCSHCSTQTMQAVLNWLYAAVQPLYANPILTYQDVSLVLSVFQDVRVRTEVANGALLLKLYTVQDAADTADAAAGLRLLAAASPPLGVQVYLPRDYPQSPPVVLLAPADSKSHTLAASTYLTQAGTFTHPLLDAWTYTHANSRSNDGVPPRENRLLVLFYTLHRLIAEHPSIWVQRIPSLPPKPSRTLPATPTRAPAPTTPAESPAVTSRVPPPLPPPPSSSSEKTTATASPASSSTALPPQLPPNPIRQALIRNASERLNAELLTLLNGSSQYSPLPPISTVLENQRKLVASYDTFNRTAKSIEGISASLGTNTPVVELKSAEASALIEKVRNYVDSDYNHEENLLLPLDSRSKQLHDLCFREASQMDSLHFLELLFNTQKISFTDYVENVRKVSRERAKLLIWINKFN